MNKEHFLSKLESSLKKLPTDERQDILQDFEAHFAFALKEGKTEEEIAAALGSPQQIAKEMIATYHIEKVEHSITTGNIIRAVLAAISLGFFNLIIVLGPFLALVSVVLAGWTVGISLIVSPILLFINYILDPETFVSFEFFLTLLACGIGIFVAIGMYYITIILMEAFVKYLKFNVNLVKGDS